LPEPDKDPLAPHARRSRAARGWAGLSTGDLALALGKKDRKYVERRENGQQDYSPGDLLKIAEVTGAPVDFIVHGAGGWNALAPTVAEEAARAAQRLAAARARNQRSNGPAPAGGAGGSEPNHTPEA
jgi:transcriptional regulator with XRE-family HTH domain